MFTSIILIIIVLAAASLLWWGVSQLALPQPVKVVVLVILGLVMLAICWNFVAAGHLGRLG